MTDFPFLSPMKDISFLTPFHPSHSEQVWRCHRSIVAAMVGIPATWEHLTLMDIGEDGRSFCRNRLQEAAQGHWLMWVDADDEVNPDFWAVFQDALDHDKNPNAVWGAICTNMEGVRPGQQYPMTLDKLMNGDPARGLNIGYVIRRNLQQRFWWNEDMDCGEDYDMYLRLWHSPAARCHKTDKVLYLNNRGEHSKGKRSATGGEWRQAVEKVRDLWRAP